MGDPLKFADPNWLYLLLLIVPLVAIKVVTTHSSREGMERVTSSRLRIHLITDQRPLGDWGRFALQLVGLALLAIALARPQKGYIEEMTRVEGRNIIIAIDTSRSMLAEDISPNSNTSRLTQAQLAAIDLIEALPDDRIGLIAFAGTAFMQAPLTQDHNAVVETITQLNTYVIQRGGTKLSAAIDLARERLTQTAAASNALIIFTDGEDHEGIALKAAEKADAENIRIITIGVGTEIPAIVPDPESRQKNTFLKDADGELIKSAMDPESLEKIAKATNGTFIALNRQKGGLVDKNLVNLVLSTISYSESDEKLKRTPRERYAIPLALGLGCIAAGFIATLWRSRPAGRPAVAAILALALLSPASSEAALPIDAYTAYDSGDFSTAKERYENAARQVTDQRALHELNFGRGAAAYQNGDYGDAVEAFSAALLSDTPDLQGRSHYNLGNTLFRQGEAMWKDADSGGMKKIDDVIRDWEDAADHYRSSLEIKPDMQDAQANLDIVEDLLEKLEELKQQQEQEEEQPDEQEQPDEEEKQEPEEQEQPQEEKEEPEEQDQEPGDEQDEESESQENPDEPSEEQPEEQEQQPGEEGEESDPGEESEQQQPSEEASDQPQPGESTDPGEEGEPSEETGEGQPGDESDQSPEAVEEEVQMVDPDDEVNEETGYSKRQARELLEQLMDEQEDLGLLRRRRFQSQSHRYRDW